MIKCAVSYLSLVIVTVYLAFDPVLLPLIVLCAVNCLNIFALNRFSPLQKRVSGSISLTQEVILILLGPLIEEHVFRLWLPKFLEWYFPLMDHFAISRAIFSLYHIQNIVYHQPVTAIAMLSVTSQICFTWFLAGLLPLQSLEKSFSIHVFYNAAAVIMTVVLSKSSTPPCCEPKTIYISKRRASTPPPRTRILHYDFGIYNVPQHIWESHEIFSKYCSTRFFNK